MQALAQGTFDNIRVLLTVVSHARARAMHQHHVGGGCCCPPSFGLLQSC